MADITVTFTDGTSTFNFTVPDGRRALTAIALCDDAGIPTVANEVRSIMLAMRAIRNRAVAQKLVALDVISTNTALEVRLKAIRDVEAGA